MLKTVHLRWPKDVEKLWRAVRNLPRRAGGSSLERSEREEWYAFGVYALALARHGLIAYPVKVEKGQRPDFMCTWAGGENTGLEITRATTSGLRRPIVAGKRLSDGEKGAGVVSIDLFDDGWMDGEREEQWCRLLMDAVQKKVALLPDYRFASRHDLLIYDDTPVIGVKRKGLDPLRERIRRINSPMLGHISVIASVDLIYDVAGVCRILPMIDLASASSQTAGEDVEFAGQVSALEALEEHRTEQRPTYSLDSRGRLVKRMPDGRRYEVRIRRGGEEEVLRQLGHG